VSSLTRATTSGGGSALLTQVSVQYAQYRPLQQSKGAGPSSDRRRRSSISQASFLMVQVGALQGEEQRWGDAY
jgi:hypothetical protein